MSWDELTELLAGELRRVIDTHGNEAIYGGSYGWASAGRFHHAQSQVHRFLKLLGGYTSSRHSYSLGATGAIMPRVVGTHDDLFKRSTAWDVIVEHTDLLVAFGGIALKNTGINHGGTTAHPARAALNRLRDRGGDHRVLLPAARRRRRRLRVARARPRHRCGDHARRWPTCWPPRGSPTGSSWTPTASATTGSSATCSAPTTVCRSRRGGPPAISGIAAEDITALARRMAAGRTLVTVSWSLQRIRHGEQAPWMGLTLAAMLGQIGLPGGGFGHGYGSMNEPGLAPLRLPAAGAAAGPQPGVDVHPGGRGVSDMLLHPGREYDYNGLRLTFPDIRLVYWAGGNPFHHHQNLPRLRRALARPDTVVVHDPYWTAMAKHADIVVPSTTAYERDDYSGSRNDPMLMAMPALAPPYAQSRDDYTTFAALAERLGVGDAVHRGPHRPAVAGAHVREVGGRSGFRGAAVRPVLGRRRSCGYPTEPGLTLLADFRADPYTHRLNTPSGRIEIFSADIDGFGYDDCPGHPRLVRARPNGSAVRARRPIRCT